MPVIGKKLEEQEKTREIRWVKARLVYPSTILPRKEPSHEVWGSVRKIGIQEPIVVRPHPQQGGCYEIIDGHNRYNTLFDRPDLHHFIPGEEPQIMVDIRYGLSDADVFKLSEALHKLQPPNTYERAEFYVRWIEAKAKELGTKEGVLTEVAKELTIFDFELNSKQSLLSQYCKIYEMFQKLEQTRPDIDFTKLKSLAMNKLYDLTNLMDNTLKLIQVVEKLIKNPDADLDTIRDWTEVDKYIDRTRTLGALIRLSPELTESFHDTLYKKNSNVFETQASKNEIYKHATEGLIKIFVDHPEKFEIDLGKTREGYKIVGVWWMKD